MKFDKKKLDDMHATALKQWEAIQDKERNARELAIEDMRFTHVAGAQSEDAFDERADVYRGEVNRVAGLVDQVTGGQRENRSGIKFLPEGNNIDNDAAEVKTGMARRIENKSDANTIYDQSFDETVTGGFGGWRYITKFKDDGFDQVIRMKAINSAASSLFFDVNATEYTKRDAKHAFLVTGIHPDLFKSEYPDATISDFPAEKYSKSMYKDWFSTDQMLIAEYWWKEPVTKTIAQLTDGRVIDLEKEKDVIDELAAKGITIATKPNGEDKTRTYKSHKVFMMKMNGAEWLTEPKEFPSKYIPLVPEFGRIAHIENETHVRGLIRFAKDPQRIYNAETSNQVQIGAELMDDPVWMTSVQAKGYEDQLENYKTERPPVMLYNSDPDAPGAPTRTGAPSVQQMAMGRIKQAEMDIYATTNMYPPSLGLNVGLESGVALKHQDAKGDRGSYVFVDNHMKSIKYGAEILEDMMGRVYDTERVVNILNIDGSVESVTINKKEINGFGESIIDEETGKEVIINNIRSSYGTVVDVSKAYSTRKEESLDQLISLINADETFKAISTDLVAKNADVLESEELYKRARKIMVKQGIAEPTDEEIKEFGLDQQQQPDPQTQAMTDNIEMDTTEKQSRIELNDRKVDEIIIKNQKAAIDSYKSLMESLKIKSESGIPITPDDLEAMNDSLAMVEIERGKIKPG